jgi:DNA-binding response OmpR family regulator
MKRGRHNVLLLEDDPVQSYLFQSIASDLLGQIEQFEDVETAMDAMRVMTFDMCIVDLGVFLAETDYDIHGGLRFIKAVRQEISRSVPIIIDTAITDPVSIIPSFDAGADDYVLKTEGIEKLVDRLTWWLSTIPYTPERLEAKRSEVRGFLKKLQANNLDLI